MPPQPSTASASSHAAQQQCTQIICYNCGEPGHTSNNCPKHTCTSTTWNALVCMAHSVSLEHAMSA
jgi:6-phosphogluconolactonase/glucosamine-6-phosphate isomerase/deaminase